jgi:hypothetical protein
VLDADRKRCGPDLGYPGRQGQGELARIEFAEPGLGGDLERGECRHNERWKSVRS